MKSTSVESRIIILVISLIALAIFYGCGSHSSPPVSVSVPSEIVLSSREVVIDEKGRLPAVTFPNGVKIEASEENTLTPGITVVVTELEKSSRNIDYFTSSYHSHIYRIIAYQTSSGLIDSKTYVTTLEKPFKITISKDPNSQGIVLAGINENESEPWRFFNLSGPSANIVNLARSSEVGPKEYTFELFRLGIQFALITYDSSAGNKIPDTFISSINASSSAYILVKDGKYTDDLTLKCILNGQNLAYMKPGDFRAKITYRNNLSKSSSINVNGIKVNQITTADSSLPGYNYAHSFLVDSLLDSNLMSSEGEFTFLLNLKNVETQNFPSGFLIEFFNKVDPEKIIPYKYTEFFTLKKAESINITLSSSDANLEDKDKNLYVLNPTFLITSNYDFDKSEKEKIAKAISVTNIDSSKVSKVWKDKTLTLSFKENLQQNTSYTISIGDVNNKEGYIITTFKNFNFTTKPELYKIEYDYNGGKTTVPNPESYDVTTAEFTLNNPTKEGYDFIGWSGTGLKGKNNLIVTIKHGSEGKRSYTANYKPTQYTITYHLSGGNITIPNPETYDITSATIQLNNPSRPYYKFIGWTSDDINTPRTIVTIEQGSTGDKSYTANWFENPTNTYSLTLSKGIGIDEVIGGGLYSSESTVNATCTMLAGYEFAFWTGNVTESTFTMPYYDVVMQANAQLINYSIAYNLNGGRVEINNPASYNINSDNLPLINPTRLGYTFLGWTGTDLDIASKTFFIPHGSTGNREYKANWSLDSYAITCNLGEGNVATPNPTTYDVASANITLTNPVSTKDYYQFKGWSGTDLEGSENLVVTIPKGSVGNRVYTANYAPEVFPITYTYEGEMAENPDSYDTTTLAFILNNPTKAGYDFLGWEGTNIPEGTASLTVIIPKGSNGARTYTASFTQRFTIEYTLNDGSLTVDNPKNYNKYTANIMLNNPTKSGYDFIGWEGTGITSGTASMAVIIPKGSEGDRTYAASFTQRFSIAYTLNGGSVAAANPVSYNKYSANIMLNNPTKADYDFLGWTGTNIPEGTASKSVVIYTGSEGNRQYVASFTERYTITYNLSDGTSSNPLSYNKYTNSFTLTTPTRTGDTSSDFYVFIGWTGTDIASVTKTVTIPQGSTGNREFTAHWLEGKSFELSPGISLKMIKCPAGTFIMGSPEGELDHSVNESQHQVTLTQDYYIGIYEVTQIQYFTAMNTNPSNFKDGLATEAPTTSANHPVETVKWSDAKNFCTWLNTNITSGVPADYHFDLPTEAQWEYACRANTTTSLNNGTNIAYSTGFDPNLIEVAWCKTNSATSTQPVGGKKPNNWGLYDMHGNVNEWCLDLRDSDWTIDYLPDPVTDPYYTTGTEYIIRGGCFNSGENKRYRSGARDGKTTTSKFSNVGFRVVLTHD